MRSILIQNLFKYNKEHNEIFVARAATGNKL